MSRLEPSVFFCDVTSLSDLPCCAVTRVIEQSCFNSAPDPFNGQGWQTSRGHKGQIFVNKKGEFFWKLLVNSSGHFCPREFLFLGEFRGHLNLNPT